MQNEYEIATELMRRHIEGNARQVQNQSEYQQQYDILAERYDNTHRQLIELQGKRQDRASRSKGIQQFMDDLRKQEVLLTSFDEELWIRMVESVTVCSGKNCRFNLKDGSVVLVDIIEK